jgi:hypothetical protein
MSCTVSKQSNDAEKDFAIILKTLTDTGLIPDNVYSLTVDMEALALSYSSFHEFINIFDNPIDNLDSLGKIDEKIIIVLSEKEKVPIPKIKTPLVLFFTIPYENYYIAELIESKYILERKPFGFGKSKQFLMRKISEKKFILIGQIELAYN